MNPIALIGLAALMSGWVASASAEQRDAFNRTVLPIPPASFKGVAGLNSKESAAAAMPTLRPRPGKANCRPRRTSRPRPTPNSGASSKAWSPSPGAAMPKPCVRSRSTRSRPAPRPSPATATSALLPSKRAASKRPDDQRHRRRHTRSRSTNRPEETSTGSFLHADWHRSPRVDLPSCSRKNYPTPRCSAASGGSRRLRAPAHSTVRTPPAHPELSFDTCALPRLCPPHTLQARVEPRPGGPAGARRW